MAASYPLESVHQGVVTNITDYGAFVELEAGVEGLVHVSEMSWTKKNVHPGIFIHPTTGEQVQFSSQLPADLRKLLDRLAAAHGRTSA